MTSKSRFDAIRILNDRFRCTLEGGAVIFAAGIVALTIEVQAQILTAVQAFDDFNDGNDPWQEHDFGALECAGEKVLFKIDYFELTRAAHAEDPADPSKTERVITIMLASEY